MTIEEITSKRPAFQQLKNYGLLDKSMIENAPFDSLGTTFIELIGCCKDLESLLSDVINDSDFSNTVAYNARSSLKRFVDDAFRMTGDIGKKAVKELKSKL